MMVRFVDHVNHFKFDTILTLCILNNVLLSLDIRRLLVLEMKENECTKWSKDALSEHFFKNYRK